MRANGEVEEKRGKEEEWKEGKKEKRANIPKREMTQRR